MRCKFLKKNIIWGYISVLVVFAFWMIFSNTIIISLSGLRNPHKISTWGDRINKNVNYFVDAIQPLNSITDSFTIMGWAFVETEEDSPNRYTSVILKSESNCYEIMCENVFRVDVVRTFQNTKMLGSENLGFGTNFSTINIEDGIYNIFIYCKENEVDYGIADTGMQFEKKKDMCEYYKWRSRAIENQLNISEQDSVFHCVDSVIAQDDRIEIWGWIFAENQDCTQQQVYLELTNEDNVVKQYTTKSCSRQDVMNAYKNEKYKESGYAASILSDNIPNGIYNLRILLECGGKVWATDNFILSKDFENIELKAQNSI